MGDTRNSDGGEVPPEETALVPVAHSRPARRDHALRHEPSGLSPAFEQYERECRQRRTTVIVLGIAVVTCCLLFVWYVTTPAVPPAPPPGRSSNPNDWSKQQSVRAAVLQALKWRTQTLSPGAGAVFSDEKGRKLNLRPPAPTAEAPPR